LDQKLLNILDETSVERKFKFIYAMFKEQGVIQKYSMQSSIFLSFLKETEKLYNSQNNPFHNFDHGITGKVFLTSFEWVLQFLEVHGVSKLLCDHPQRGSPLVCRSDARCRP
jgi:hypothetical protein